MTHYTDDEPGLIDTNSFRVAMGDAAWRDYDRRLRDEWAAKCFFFNKRQRRIKAASDRIAHAANEQIGGLRPTTKLDPWAYAWLNKYMPGWQTDPSFERDLIRHHPEVAVKLEKRMNRVGWTSALKGAESVPVLPKAAPRTAPLVALTDERGNAAA